MEYIGTDYVRRKCDVTEELNSEIILKSLILKKKLTDWPQHVLSLFLSFTIGSLILCYIRVNIERCLLHLVFITVVIICGVVNTCNENRLSSVKVLYRCSKIYFVVSLRRNGIMLFVISIS